MKKGFVFMTIIVLVVCCGIAGVFIFNKTKFESDKEKTSSKIDMSKNRGFSISPRSFEGNDYQNFYNIVSENSEYLTWSGDWIELCENNKSPYNISKQAKSKNLKSIAIAQFFHQNTGKLIRPITGSSETQFKDCIKSYIQSERPEFFGIGIEINILYEKSPNDFNTFVNIFNLLVNDIKKQNSTTKVFTVFQLERLKGLKGGLFGGKNDITKNNWDLLKRFEKSDLLAFTSYPFLVFDNPNEIPENYYEEIKTFTSKPIGFSEIGWSTANLPNGWKSDEDEQVAFIDRFFYLNRTSNPEFYIWSFLFDQKNAPDPFKDLGLYNSTTNLPKKGFQAFK